MLRIVRSEPARSGFDGAFFERDDRFWPIAGAARRFADRAEWPAPDDYNALLPSGAPVRFVEQVVPPARRRGEVVRRRPEELYDARIMSGEVPTRRRSWHDYLNALVWATFPLAKRALHARQHEVITRWLADAGVVQQDGTFVHLPNARTRLHDALALIDEGGIVVMCSTEGELPIVFGHALYEGLVLGTSAMISRGVGVEVDGVPDRASALAVADERLALRLAQPLEPEDLPRYALHCASQ